MNAPRLKLFPLSILPKAGDGTMSNTWKYRVIYWKRSDDNEAARILEEVGQEGWELVAVDSNDPKNWTLFLKQQDRRGIC
jgi:hypothetical protein